MAARFIQETEEVWHRSPREVTSMELLGELQLAEPAWGVEPVPGEETGKKLTYFHRVPAQASLVMLLPAHDASLQRLPALLLNTRPRLS